MTKPYEPKQYWEQRLSDRFTLKGVGHLGFSESYNTWLYRRKQRCIESCLSGTNLKGKKVLDIGCGTGFFVEWYLQKGASICGIDITDISIKRLKQKYQGEFQTQDITDPNYQLYSREFDIINMWDVVYHIVDPKRFNLAFDNIAKSMRDGGLLLFTDWFGASSDVRIADHVQGRCLDTYTKSLPKKGFELVGMYPLYCYLNKTHLKRLDNYLGWLYLLLDNFAKKIPDDNLSLSAWRYSQNNAKT
jgi:SAM-dependent methyltransferase